MPTVLGSSLLTVPAAAAWTVGPTFRKGETIRVRSWGTVAWGAATAAGAAQYIWSDIQQGGSGTAWALGGSSGYSTGRVDLPASATSRYVTSAPGNLVLDSGSSALPANATVVGVELAFRFDCEALAGSGGPAPASGDLLATLGVYVGGTLVRAYPEIPLASGAAYVSVGGPTDPMGRAWPQADLATLDYRISVRNSRSGAGFSVGAGPGYLRFYFTVPVAAPYALPEGAYPPGYPSDHALDPASVLQAGAWTGTPLVASGRPPLSLAMLVLPDGQTPPFAATSGCLSPGRDSSYEAAAIGAADPNALYRLWFAVNDGLGDFSDDSGGYSVLVDRLNTKTMSEPLTSLTKPRLGLQTALATRALATRMLGCIADKGFKIKPDQTWEDYGTAGFGYKTGSTLTYDVSSGDVTLNLDTLDTGYVLYSVFGGEVVTQLASGVYQHVFEYSPFRQAVSPGYSVELPTEQGDLVQRTIDLVFNGLKLSTSPDKRPTASTSFMGGKLVVPEDADLAVAYDGTNNGTNTGALSPGMNSIQVVTLNGVPTGGTFVLLDGNKPTTAIAYNAAASAVQTALQALPAYATATVSGAAGGPWTVTNPTGREQRPLVPSYTTVGGTPTLTGGASPTVTVGATNAGGMKINQPALCLAQSWVVSVAPTWAQLENAPVQLTDNWSSEITIGERYERKWVQGATPGNFRYVQKDGSAITDTLSLEMAFVPQVRTFINASRSGSRLAARLRSTGDLIPGTAFNRSLTIDMDGQAKWPDNSDSDNVRSVKIDFEALYNMASGTMVRLTLVNEVPSYSVF